MKLVFENAREVDLALQRAEQRLTGDVKAGVDAFLERVFSDSQAKVPVRTGRLKASGRKWSGAYGGSIVGAVEYTAPYARTVQSRRPFLADPEDEREADRVRNSVESAITLSLGIE